MEPYPRWATVTALPSVDETGPIEPVTETEAEEPPAEETAETPARTGPEAADPVLAEELDQPGGVESGEQFGPASAEPAVPLDPQPVPPPKPKESAWEYATSVGYWMSVSVGAAGQIFALADLMDIGWLSYPVAAAGAAFAEVTMIGASKRARNHRIAEHPKPWKLLLVIACVICGYATAMNAIHWLRYSVGMAVMFAGGSAVGFTVETTVEHIEAAEYERRRARYEDDYRRWQNRQKSRSAAPASSSTTSKAATTRSATSSSQKQPAKTTATKARKAAEQQRLSEIVQWAKTNKAGPRRAHQHFGRPTRPSESTIKRALKS